MSDVKRYDVGGYGGGMIEAKDGIWYHEDDYASIEADRKRLLDALEKISSIEDRYNCGDWDEIEEARNIALEALELSK